MYPRLSLICPGRAAAQRHDPNRGDSPNPALARKVAEGPLVLHNAPAITLASNSAPPLMRLKMPSPVSRNDAGTVSAARRDNLESYWKSLFGWRHAVCLVQGFYEKVARHDFEKRELRPGEKPENLLLHFNPQPASTVFVACLWIVGRSRENRISIPSSRLPTTRRPKWPPLVTTVASSRSGPGTSVPGLSPALTPRPATCCSMTGSGLTTPRPRTRGVR